MTKEALKLMSDAMSEMGLTYEFMEFTTVPTYPYFVGEYQESETASEDGLQEATFILNGFARDTGEGNTAYLELENAKEKIYVRFGKVGGDTVITAKGAAIAVFYSNALIVPTDDAELKRIQINLKIKEWRVK